MSDTEERTLEVEVAEVADLTPDPKNARRHPPRSIAAIAGSLSEFGQAKPIVVRHGVVIAGNGTLLAALSLGWTRLAAVRLPDEWDDAKVRAYAIADNRTSDLATWDYEELVASLGDIGEAALIEAAGFTSEEYDDMLARLQEAAAPETGPGSGGFQDGMTSQVPIQDYAARYADKSTRLLVLEYPNAVWLWAEEHLVQRRGEWHLDTNADVVLRIMAEAFGDAPPAPGSPGDLPPGETAEPEEAAEPQAETAED